MHILANMRTKSRNNARLIFDSNFVILLLVVFEERINNFDFLSGILFGWPLGKMQKIEEV